MNCIHICANNGPPVRNELEYETSAEQMYGASGHADDGNDGDDFEGDSDGEAQFRQKWQTMTLNNTDAGVRENERKEGKPNDSGNKVHGLFFHNAHNTHTFGQATQRWRTHPSPSINGIGYYGYNKCFHNDPILAWLVYVHQ